jgi:hypothetical protein
MDEIMKVTGKRRYKWKKIGTHNANSIMCLLLHAASPTLGKLHAKQMEKFP